MQYLKFKFTRVSLVAILMIMPGAFFGQISLEVKKDSSGAAIPSAIQVVNVVGNIESANQEIRLTSKKIVVGSDVKRIDSLFPGYEDFLKEELDRKNHFVKANPNRQKINNLIKKWEGYYDRLSRWEKVINESEQRNMIIKEQLDFKEKTWQLTYENAEDKKVPLEVLTNVRVVWHDYKDLNEKITKENNKFLVLESKITDQKFAINQVVDELNSLKNSEIYDLFYLRHKPLWKVSFKSQKEDEGDKDEVESVSGNITAIITFMQTSEDSLYLFALLVAIVVFVIQFLKKSFQEFQFNEQNEDLQHAKDVMLNHSVVSMVFVSLIIAKTFFTNTPMLFGNILVFLILVFSIFLVQPYMYKRFKKIIYFAVVLYVLDSAKTYMWFTSPQYRLYLLFEAFFVIAVLIYFTYPYLKTRKMKIGPFGILLIRLTPVLYGLLLVSVISNILGYTNLSDLTLKISAGSGVITIIFYGILMIAGGISTGYIHWHFSHQTDFDPERKFNIELKLLKVIRVLAFIIWFLFFLGMVDLLTPLSQSLTYYLSEPYKFGSITFTIGDVLRFVTILAISFTITSIISYLFEGGDVSLKFLKLPKGIPAAISLVLRYFIIAFGFVLALSSLGIDLSKFNLMAGALGLGIGFGLQTVISNFVSGLILVFERPIHQGDTVEVNNLLGTVKRIGVRSSSIITFDGAEVVVPNNNLISNDLINWTLSDSIKRVEILIGSKYGSDPNQVLQILTDVAMNNKDTLKNPAPVALFSEFGDSSLNFKLRFWVHYEVGLKVKSDISIAIYNEFTKHGIEIPFPQQDIYIKDMPKTETKSLGDKTSNASE